MKEFALRNLFILSRGLQKFLVVFSTTMESLPLKELDFGLHVPNYSRASDSAEEKLSLLIGITLLTTALSLQLLLAITLFTAALSLQLLLAITLLSAALSLQVLAQLLMTTSRVMTFWRRRMHGPNMVYPKYGKKIAHAFTADTRLSSFLRMLFGEPGNEAILAPTWFNMI